MSLAQRSITSLGWNVLASLSVAAILFVRSVLLARLLPVDTFGVYAAASAVVGLTVVLPAFGMGGAFLHRTPETGDEDRAAAVHFTLKLLFTMAWALLMATGALLFAEGSLRTALLVLTFANAGIQLAQTPQMILTRRVVHRRLALLQTANAALSTAVALLLAWRGATLWALLATDLVTLLLTILMLYVWRPVWRPHFAWENSVVRYFLSFGSRVLASVGLLSALDNVDDLWTGYYLGPTALGYYSRAYTFATYPRRVLAGPVNSVTGGTYAELKDDPRRLSQAFFRSNALLIRSGFLFAGLLALVAPEFIRLLLGVKWLPMLDAFRLMLIFTMLDPIKVTVASLFVAVGVPGQVVRVRLVQLAVLGMGLYILGTRWGITGVAIAVDLMLVVGMVLLFRRARRYVQFSALRLFAVPTLALLLGLLISAGVVALPGMDAAGDWTTGLVKTLVFTTLYGVVLLSLERNQTWRMVQVLLQQSRQVRPG